MSKNTSITIRLVAAVLLSIIISAIFVNPNAKLSAEIYRTESTFGKSNVDFIVTATGLEQADVELKNNSAVKKIAPYYESTSYMQFGTSRVLKTVIELSDFENLEATVFNSNRLVNGALPISDSEVIIDENLSNELGLSVGNTIEVEFGRAGEKVSMTVAAIIENTSLYKYGVVVTEFSGKQKEIIDAIYENSVPRQYAGAFITAENNDALKALLDNYKPMANVPLESEFDTEIQYLLALSAFNEKSYHQYVSDVNAVQAKIVADNEGKADEVLQNTIIAVVLCVILVLGIEVVLFAFRRKILTSSINGGSSVGSLLRLDLLTQIVALILSAGIVIIFTYLCKSSLFVPLSSLFSVGIPISIAFAVAHVVAIVARIVSLTAIEKKLNKTT